MRRLSKFLIFLCANGVIFGLVFAVMFKSGLFKVTHIELKTSEDKAAQAMFEVHGPGLSLKLARFKGREIWNVDVGEIAASVHDLSWIRGVSVRRVFPNTIRLDIDAKPVSAVVVTDAGKLVPISTDSSLLPPLPATKFPDVPIVRDRRILRDQKLRSLTVQLLRELPADGLLSAKNIAEVSSDHDDQFWLSLIEDGLQIKIGIENVPLRAARVEKVLEYLRSNQLQARVIDADFSKKVVVKLRKDR
ncbi:MAG: FtsQ-type POTRA domain-containing protein [Bdellovibrionia bacterium]